MDRPGERWRWHDPPLESIDTRAPRAERVAELTRALVARYAGMPGLERLRSERHEIKALDAGMRFGEESVAQLIRRALGKGAGKRKVAIVAAIADMAVINRLLESGKLKVRVATVLPLAEVKKAHQLSASGHADGKIILRP